MVIALATFTLPVSGLVSVVIRTVPGRTSYLDAALFSLQCQDYKPLEVVVVYQGPAGADYGGLLDLLEEYRVLGLDIRLVVNPANEDQRSRNLNLGLMAASGQYVAFLDDDDVVYARHYVNLVEAIKTSGSAWSYGNTYQANMKFAADGSLYVASYSRPFEKHAYSFIDHYLGNFIPIHSFCVDRATEIGAALTFDESMIRHEDYDALLRLSSQSKPAVSTEFTCEYRIRLDGSNTVLAGTSDVGDFKNKSKSWAVAQLQLERTRDRLDTSLWNREVFAEIARLRGEVHRLSLLVNDYGGVQCESKPLRYRLSDKINSALKRLPLAHKGMRRLGTRMDRVLESLRRQIVARRHRSAGV
ncbi:MAG: glycosyltransferase family 2 protein [Candidatus Sericytochromatia bacterium]|nr:glycosyltransferase family 2 protein [Candidatus Tanganyikabacteria bacterium]